MYFKKIIVFLIILLSTYPILAEEQGEWTDLIPLINLKKHIVSGEWKISEFGIEVEASENARLFLPSNKSNNYDLKVSFTRKTGQHSIALIFNSHSGQASFEVDAWGQHLAGVQMIDGRAIKDNETRVNNIRLENGKKYTLELRVRDKNITGLLNDQVLVKLNNEGKSFSILDLWKLSDNNMIGLGAYQSNTEFHSIQIRDVVAEETKQDHEKIKEDTKTSEVVPVKLNSLSEMSDEFDSEESIANWQRIFQTEGSKADQLQTIRIEDGVLNLVPYTSSWYNDYRGVLVYKMIKGDFIVTTRIKATGIQGKGVPNKLYSLAGIMVRTPKNISLQTWQPGQENYIFLSIGSANKPGESQFEVKTTINSNSKLEINAASSNEAEIKIFRVGASFILLKREINGEWNVHKRYYRPDMPETLQVGMTVYTDWSNVEKINPRKHNQIVIRDGNPDLSAQFDFFRFKRPVIPNNYQNLNFMSTTDISDKMILEIVK